MDTSRQTPLEMLRSASASGNFAAAEESARLYAGTLKSALPQLPPAVAAECLREACATIEWSRRCLCAARTRLADELRRAQGASAYRQAPSAPAHTWKITA